jgi:hypothetical protein
MTIQVPEKKKAISPLEPAYLKLLSSGELEKRVIQAYDVGLRRLDQR